MGNHATCVEVRRFGASRILPFTARHVSSVMSVLAVCEHVVFVDTQTDLYKGTCGHVEIFFVLSLIFP